MAMKYLKLFENWLVSEGKQVEAFDAAKPNMWPVMETTIENAQEAKLSAKFLKSIFGRAMDEGNRAKLEISEPSLSSPKVSFPIRGYHNSNKSQNTDLKKYDDFVDLVAGRCESLVTYAGSLKNQSPLQYFAAREASKVIEKLQQFIDVISKPGKTEFEQEGAFKRVFKDKSSTFKQNCIKMCERWKKILEKKVEEAGNQQVMSFDIAWDNTDILTVVLDKEIGKGNEKSDIIIHYKCKKLQTNLPEYIDQVDDEGNALKDADGNFLDPKENELYKSLRMDDIIAIDYKEVQLTFGMIMAWLNRWQDGESLVQYLSKTGTTEYKDVCKNEIFDGEEREFLAEFKSTSFDIGGKSIKLANTKADGTIVPVLALNKVVGTVGFAFNSYKISEEGLKSLDSPDLWKALATAKKSIVIVGNTDSIGSDEINDALSEKRAKAVLDELMKNKKASSLKTKNITKRGDGKKNPLKPDNKGKDKEASALNRRVEIIIDGKPASDVLKGQL